MDATQFDAISRVLGTQSRRRGMLKAVAGVALGLVGLSGLAERALAKKCDKDKDCNGKDVCKNGKCVECAKDKDCDGNDVCKNDKCVECANDDDCPSDQQCDNDRCVECTNNDDCRDGQQCNNNSCE